jgi:PAS domain-containing protein
MTDLPGSPPLLDLVLEALPCPVWAYDAAHRLAFANAAAGREVGAEARLPLGTPFVEVLTLLAHRGLLGSGEPATLMQGFLAVDRSRPMHRLVRQADGRMLDVHSLPLPGGGFANLAVDVSALTAAGEEAEALARRLEDMLHRLHAGLAVYDADHRLVLNNSAYERLLGLPRGLLPKGTAYPDLLRELARRGEFANTDTEALLANRAAVDRTKPARHQRERPNGRVLQFESQPVAEGGWLVELTDITAMKRAEDEARGRAALLDGVLESLPLGVLVVGPDERIRMVNGSYARLLAEAGVVAVPGESRQALALRLAEAGDYGPGDPATLVAERLEQRDDVRRRVRASGQVVEARYARLPDGGHVQVVADITLLHQAQAEASQRAELMQLMLDSMRHGIALFDADSRLIAANALAARLIGLPPDAMQPGVSLIELRRLQLAQHEFGTAEEAAALVAISDRHDRLKPYRYTRRRPDGTTLDIASDPTPGGGFVRTYIDITARAQAEAEARQQAATLQALLDNLRLGITLFGPDHRVVASNALSASMAGLPPGTIRPGALLEELTQGQEAANAAGNAALSAELSALAVAQDRRQPTSHTRPTADGRLLEVRSDPMPDGGFIISHNDITPLARAEAEAARRASMLQAALDNMRHGIALFGPDHRLVVANALATQVGDQAGALPPGMTLEAMLRGHVAAGFFDQEADVEAAIARLVNADRSVALRNQRRLRDGRIFEVASDPTPDGGFVITYSDITARARAEAAAAQHARDLQVMQDHMRHGIGMYGPDKVLRTANALFRDLCGLPPETVMVGQPYAQLVRAQRDAGVFGTDPAMAAATERELNALDRTQRIRHQRHWPDGRIMEITSEPTEDGGFVVCISDITALGRARQEAQQRADLQQAMLDNIQHGLALYGPDRRLRIANRLAGPGVGLPELTMRPGDSFDGLVQTQRREGAFGPEPQAGEVATAVVALDRTQRHRYLRHLPNGTVVEVASAPTPDGGFVITHSDITPLEQARAEAQHRAGLLQAMLDNVQHGIAVYDAGGLLVTANRLAADYCGLTPEEMAPGTPQQAMLRLQFERGAFGAGAAAETFLEQSLARDWHQPRRFQRTDSRGRVLDISVNPMPDGGYVLGWSDITALLAAQAEAARRAEVLNVMMNTMRHGISLYDADQRLVAANQLVGTLNGTPPGMQRIGWTLRQLMTEQQALGRATEAQKQRQLALDRSRPDRVVVNTPGDKVLEIRSDPTPDGGFIITHSDVTELSEARAEAQHRADLLQVMMEAMRHGIALFDRDRRLLQHNALGARLAGLAGEIAPPGTTFADIVAEQLARGEIDASHADMALSLDRSRPTRYLRQGPDGSTLEIGSDPTPDGGFVMTLTDVTSLALSEAQSRDRAALLQLMLDSMRHGIVRYDRERRLVTANRLALELHGLPPDTDLVGLREPDIVRMLYERGEVDEAAWLGSVRADITTARRTTRTRPDGTVVSFTADPTADGGYVVTVSDISDLVAAENAARQRAAILQVMLDNIRHGICYYGRDRRVIAANALAARLGGHRAAELRPGTLLDDLLAEQLENGAVPTAATAIAHQALALDRSRPARHVRPTSDGRVLEVTSDPTPDGGFVVTSTDITRMVEAEAVAQSRAATLGVMLDNIRHGIVLFGADQRIVAANPRVRAMLGLPEHTVLLGLHLHDYIRRLAQLGVYGSDAEAPERAEGTIGRFDPSKPNRHVRTGPQGQMIEVVSDPTPDGGFVLTYTDVTEDRAVRGELEAARGAAEAANLAKSRFLATMTHELRTPLNAVIGFSEALQTAPDAERSREYLGSIHEAGRHLLSLIDDILDVTRAETTGFQVAEGEVEVQPLCESVVRVMQAAATSGKVRLGLDLAADLPALRADQVRLRQVLLNLLSNAVKFTPPGGNVTLSAALAADGGMVLKVRDTGIGVRPEDMPRSFQPFSQLDSSLTRRFPGSGLGLYLSRALAEAQGATLTLESGPGEGATAILRFPPARLIPAGPAAAPPPPLFAP